MSKIDDQDYLRKEQYKDSSNLDARIRLHVEFSTNPYGWFRWVFDQYELSKNARVLELGCGPGDLWLENIHRIPEGWEVTLSDFSSGMLNRAWEKLADQPHPFQFETIDAQSIPYETDHFDILIANHFLYHVPDRKKAISEIRRVLRPGGRLYASTIGINHMKELPEMVARFDPENSYFLASEDVPFIMENGKDQLKDFFTNIETRRYQDGLRVTDVDIMVDYAYSGMRLGLAKDNREAFAEFLAREMDANGGVITIQKDSGMFLAR